jgi:hypothetical protein
VKGNSVFFKENNVNREILFKKLSWKVLYTFCWRGVQKVSFIKWRFGGGLDKSFFRNFDVGPIFSLYRHKFSNCCSSNSLCFYRFFSSSWFLLKDKFDNKSGKFKNVFSLICSSDNLQKGWYEIKSNPGNLNCASLGLLFCCIVS